jgi:tRNA(fMet)-specific endonuclease VapC
MSRFLLDTNICVHILNGDFDLVEKIQRIGLTNCFISELTVAELLYGVAGSAPDRQTRNRQNLDKFLSLFPRARRLSISDALEIYAEQKVHLKRMGRLQGEFDMLIGCTALAHVLTLATRNTRHFADLQGIQLENWIDDLTGKAAATRNA